MSMLRLAMFDFDGTLCADNTLHLLMAQQLREGPMGALRIAGWSVARKFRMADSRRFKEGVLSRYRGWTPRQLADLGEEFYRDEIRPRLRADGLRELARCRAEGSRLVLVTGAFDFLVLPFVREFSFADCLCCRVEVRDDRITGRIAGPEMLGREKRGETLSHFSGHEVDWSASIAFTDDWRDLPWLKLAGQRKMVAGTAGLPSRTGVENVTWR